MAPAPRGDFLGPARVAPGVRWVVLALLFLAPLANAQSGVTLSDVRVPDLTVAGSPWEAHVRVTNDETPRTVYLFAALYAPAEGKSCGAATDPRFRAFTPLLQARIVMNAGAVVDYPPEGDSWLQKYEPNKVPQGSATMEWCVFAAEDGTGNTAQINYLAFQSVALATRSQNSAPIGFFTWSPPVPEATQDVVFTAEGADQDGDDLSYHWDFGHANASGRAVATGPVVSTFFYPAGTFPVTLRISDGYNETVITQDVRIAEEGNGVAEPTPERAAKTPVPFALVGVAVVIAALAARRRSA